MIVGITIGPILKTILSAKSTGQLWGSSYLFSYISKSICVKCQQRQLIDMLYLPAEPDDTIVGVGLYPDRIIFRTVEEQPKAILKEKLKVILDEIFEEVISDVVMGVAKDKDTQIDYNLINRYIRRYIQLNYCIVEALDNPIIEMNQILDSLELNKDIALEEEQNILMEFMKNATIKKSFLAEDAGVDGEAFPSVDDIAARSRNKTKYYAIVQSDGDGVGAIIKAMKFPEKEIHKFSKLLTLYVKHAVDELREYDAEVIYAGGDDLLFFAPLVGRNGKSIFHLLDCLNEIFKQCIGEEFPDFEANVSISFGVTISYHKYPLYESLSEAQYQLFYVAKKYKLGKREKNATAVKLIKHSGRSLDFIVQHNSVLWKELLALVEQNLEVNIRKIQSVKNFFRQGEYVLDFLLKEGRAITHYFDNKFNHEIHKGVAHEYIQYIEDMIHRLRDDGDTFNADQLFNLMEVADFITGNENDKGEESIDGKVQTYS